MIRLLLFILTITLSSLSFSQVSLNGGISNENREPAKPMLLKSTITTVGSATSTLLFREKYKVIESIGQSGVIGKSEFNNTEIQQGFLTNTRFFKVNNNNVINFQETLNIIISPNPFTDYIKIDFSSKTQYPIYLTIYDTNGKVFTYKEYQASDSIIVPMKKFSIGAYLVRLVSGEHKYVEKIFKTQ